MSRNLTARLIRPLIIFTSFAIAGTTHPANALQAGAAVDEFESAIARQAPPAPGPRRGGSWWGREGDDAPARRSDAIAPAGAIPAEWRGVRVLDRDGWSKADRAGREGRLDPYAFLPQVVGPIPLPPGAAPARCDNTTRVLHFTTGQPVSAEYDRLRQAAATDNMAAARFWKLHLAMASEATRARMDEYGRFYVGQGFEALRVETRRFDHRLFRRAARTPGEPNLRVEIVVDANSLIDKCAEKGVTIPTGPIINVTAEIETIR